MSRIFANQDWILYLCAVKNNIIILLIVLALTACSDKVPESQIAAQVGRSILSVNEVRMQVPMGYTGADSAAFVRDYIDRWVDEHIMYEQGLRNLPDIDKLNQQADDYRRDLIAQTYENELVRQRVSANITDEECQAFYDKYQKQLRVEQPIIQGVFIKILLNSSKLKEIQGWLKSLNDGKTDCIEEFDQYGTHRAADYDNFFDQWVDMYRLTDKLPATVVDAASFLKCKTYEMKDDDYYYLFVIKDYRLAGEIQPYEFAKQDIFEILVQQRRMAARKNLVEQMKSDGLRSGFVKVN